MRAAYEVMFRKMGALCFVAAIGLLSACAAPSSYMGIALTPGIAAPDVQALAARARDGDKRAQLELGIRFEEGRGVPINLEKAKELYTLAARNTQIRQAISAPNGGAAEAHTLNAGVGRGLGEAEKMLSRIQDTGFQESGSLDLVKSQGEPVVDGYLGQTLADFIKFELYSDKCLARDRASPSPISPLSDAVKRLNCLKTSKLPENCKDFSYAILRAVKIIRYDASFGVLRDIAPKLLESCVDDAAQLNNQRQVFLSIFDIRLAELNYKPDDFDKKFNAMIEASAAHSRTSASFEPQTFLVICRAFRNQKLRLESGAWLLFCNIDPETNDLSNAVKSIDNKIEEMGLNDWY